jgi:ABC-2 type transport system permease protein
MMGDVGTVARKELQEIMSRGGPSRGRRTAIGSVIFPMLIGAVLGFQAGTSRLSYERAFAVFPVALLAMATGTQLITDAVAGERERHTLETLLASPISDTAILLGKLLAVVGYVWAISVAQLVAVAISSAAGGHIISPALLVIVAVLALLEAGLAAGFGVQFSLRAPTVRAAARKSAQYSIVVNLLGSGVNVLVVGSQSGLLRLIVVGAAVLVLVAADLSLFAVARARFRRGRLLLD